MFKGFFNRMYNGNPNRPDLDPGDMPKNRFELFFTTLGVRIGDLMKLNMLLIVFLLPIELWTIWTLMAMNAGLAGIDMSGGVPQVVTENLLSQLSFYLMVNIVLLPLAGPPLAGMTYVVRNYARDEHAWLWSDFRDHMKANWKQSMLLMLILALIMFLSFVVLSMYAFALQTQQWLWFMMTLYIIFLSLFVLSYMYAFPMMVTYKLKLGQILRNSLMLSMGRLPFTIIFGVLAAFPVVLAILIFGATGSPIALLALALYYALLGITLTAFITNSYTNATFDRLMRSDSGQDDRRPPLDPEDREIKP